MLARLTKLTTTYDADLSLALRAAAMSPDPSTQNGAVLRFTVGVLAEQNRFPDGVGYTPARWERPLKYAVIEHAERNVIYRAARAGWATEGATLICPWAACADCARAIIQAGIVRLVRFEAHASARWDDSIAIGDEMMREAGVEIVEVPMRDGAFGITLRRNGEPLAF
jgi:dCMP deaminase